MSVPFSIITGKGSTREYVVSSNNVYPVSSYTGMPVTLSVSLSSLPLSADKDFIVFAVNDNFVLIIWCIFFNNETKINKIV